MKTMPLSSAEAIAKEKHETKLAQLRAQIAELQAGLKPSDFAEDPRVNVRPIRRWFARWNHASQQVSFNARLLETMNAPFFPLEWLKAVAKPGERVTLSVQW